MVTHGSEYKVGEGIRDQLPYNGRGFGWTSSLTSEAFKARFVARLVGRRLVERLALKP